MLYLTKSPKNRNQEKFKFCMHLDYTHTMSKKIKKSKKIRTPGIRLTSMFFGGLLKLAHRKGGDFFKLWMFQRYLSGIIKCNNVMKRWEEEIRKVWSANKFSWLNGAQSSPCSPSWMIARGYPSVFECLVGPCSSVVSIGLQGECSIYQNWRNILALVSTIE